MANHSVMGFMRMLPALATAGWIGVSSAHCGERPDTIPRSISPRPQLVAAAGAGAVMVAEGALSQRKDAPEQGAGASIHSSAVVDVAQYLPIAFPWVVKACGVSTRGTWVHLAVAEAFSTTLMAGGVYLTKHSIRSVRPDGSDSRSFPSGHTAWAFMGATCTAFELGEVSPWYAVGAYAFAGAVGAQRVISERHFPADVAAGAGIGIFAASLGYYFSDLIFGSPESISFCHKSEKVYAEVATSMLWPVGRNRRETMEAVRWSATAGWPATARWAVSARLMLQSIPLRSEPSGGYQRMENGVGLTAGARYRQPLSARFEGYAEAAAGCLVAVGDESGCSALVNIEAGASAWLTQRLKISAGAGYSAAPGSTVENSVFVSVATGLVF